jgi:hypothetical protein
MNNESRRFLAFSNFLPWLREPTITLFGSDRLEYLSVFRDILRCC